VIILILGQTLFNQELPFKLRLLCVVFCVIVFYRGFVGITWLSGWVPSVVGISILLLFRSRKWLVLFLIVVSVVVVLRADTWRQVVEAENTESGVTRVAAWNRALRLVDDHLLFGTGPAGYYFYMLVYGGARQLSHNNFLDILSQTGIIGFICFVWLWLAIGWTTWRMYRSIPRPGFRYGLAGSLVAAYFVSIVCMMLGDWITPFPYTQTLRGIDYTIWHWMMAGLTVALYYERQHPATDPLKSSAMAPSSTLVAQSNP
jgi:O-antigen ligase